jgi:hypothetical protein
MLTAENKLEDRFNPVGIEEVPGDRCMELWDAESGAKACKSNRMVKKPSLRKHRLARSCRAGPSLSISLVSVL